MTGDIEALVLEDVPTLVLINALVPKVRLTAKEHRSAETAQEMQVSS